MFKKSIHPEYRKYAFKTLHQLRVEEMMAKAGQLTPSCPTLINEQTRILRARLILEEALELVGALGVEVRTATEVVAFDKLALIPVGRDMPLLEDIAKECADLIVVTTGTLSACGISDLPILEAVDANNLSKFGHGSYVNEHGKLIKPPNHPKPDIKTLLEKQL